MASSLGMKRISFYNFEGSLEVFANKKEAIKK